MGAAGTNEDIYQTHQQNHRGGPNPVTSLTAEADSFDRNRRLFSAVHPVVSPEPPEGPVQARIKQYGHLPTDFRRGTPETPIPPMANAAGPLGAH